MKKICIIIAFLFILSLLGCNTLPKENPEIIAMLNPGVDTVLIHTSFIDSGITATAESKDVTVRIISNNIDLTKLGRYEIIYEAWYAKKSTQVTRVVYVVDSTPPNITLNPGIDTIKIGTIWHNMGANVTDNSLETLSIITSGEVDSNTLGTYLITYSATDSSGNTGFMTRYVHVIE